jgi:ribosomal protein L40E
MAREEKGAADAPERKYYYSVCKNCGAKLHIDNMICGRCGKRYKDFGEIPTLYVTDEDPGVYRHNLDFPEGCPACAASCGYCYSFGAPFPSPKAGCGECGKWRAACCKKARRLAVGFDRAEIAGCRSHVPETGNAAPHWKSA